MEFVCARWWRRWWWWWCKSVPSWILSVHLQWHWFGMVSACKWTTEILDIIHFNNKTMEILEDQCVFMHGAERAHKMHNRRTIAKTCTLLISDEVVLGNTFWECIWSVLSRASTCPACVCVCAVTDSKTVNRTFPTLHKVSTVIWNIFTERVPLAPFLLVLPQNHWLHRCTSSTSIEHSV